MSKIAVRHIAKLANLPLTDEEIKKFEKQLSAIVEYVEQLKKVDISKTPETSQVTGLTNKTRPDDAAPSLTQDAALSNVKDTENGMIVVDAILEE